MSTCAECGYDTTENLEFHPSHVTMKAATWPQANKVWCDYFHRGQEIPRLYLQPLTDPVWDDNPYGDHLP